MMRSREGTPNEGTKGNDEGKEVSSRGSTPRPLRPHEILQGTPPKDKSRSGTPMEQVAALAERIMTPELGGPSDNSHKLGDTEQSQEDKAWMDRRKEIAKGKVAEGKRKAKPMEKEGPSKKFKEGENKPHGEIKIEVDDKSHVLDLQSMHEERSKKLEDRDKSPSPHSEDFGSDHSDYSDGSDRSSGGDSGLQHELDRVDEHIKNFKNYTKNNKEALDTALESEGMDRKKLNTLIDSIEDITDVDSGITLKDTINRLRIINKRFDEIEKTVKFILETDKS